MTECSCLACGETFDHPMPVDVPAFAARFKPTICRSCAAKQMAEHRAAAAAAEMATRRIPPRFASMTFEDYVASTQWQRRALEACRDHAERGIFLLGRPGVGKTLLAACAVKAGPPGSLFISIGELLDDSRAGYSGAGEDLFARARRAPLLALDDLGAEQTTPWVRDRLHALIDDRYRNLRPIMVTTNYPASDLAERLGDAIVSRLVEMCAHRIEVDGVDRRRVPVGSHAD